MRRSIVPAMNNNQNNCALLKRKAGRFEFLTELDHDRIYFYSLCLSKFQG